MNNQALKISEEIEYLGATLSNNANSHVLKRVQKCRQAFYVPQGAGMCKDGVEPRIISYLWKTALQPILFYANECSDFSSRNVNDINKIQSKFVKASLGLSKFLCSTPLLTALSIPNANGQFHN